MVQSLHHRDFRAEHGIGAGQLQADDAAAHHHHALRQTLQAQGAGGVDAVGILRQAGNRRHRIDGAGGHDHGVGGQGLPGAVGSGDLQGLWRGEVSLAFHTNHPGAFEQRGDAAGQLFGHSVFVGHHLGEIHFCAGHLHAQLRPLGPEILQQFRAAQQALGGNTAHVQAGTAQFILLNNGNLGSQLGRPESGHVAAGTTAHHQNRF